jgi:hypothetical protein
MATFTSAGLPNNGQTAHYQISYDTTLSTADGLTRATALFNACEADFNLMSSWFAGVGLVFKFPLPVQIGTGSNGASWSNPSGFQLSFGYVPTVSINPGSGTSANVVRYLLVSEVVEMFMVSKNNQWAESTSFFQGGDEGSKGEGLSRFLGVQFLLANGLGGVPPAGFGVVPTWLNGSRPDFVNNDPDDNKPDVVTGCTTLYMYFLFNQLGFSIPAIINAGASNLAGVFKNLTGQADGWTPFINMVNSNYPQGFFYTPAGDNIFPVSTLTQFFAPNQITCGYSQTTMIFIDRPAMAQVNITLTSDNPGLVQVPATVTIPVGAMSVSVTISSTPQVIPFAPKFVNVHATYAGKTLTAACEVVPPYVVGLSISPASVTCGDSATGTITLNEASLLGPVVVTMINGSPGFATVPVTVTIPQNQKTINFTITTPNIAVAFKTAICSIYATYSGSSASAVLSVVSRVVAPIMNSLTINPTMVSVGQVSRGTVTLVQAVPMAAVITIEALDPAVGPGGPIPTLPGNPSSYASVPPNITIAAGQVTGTFNISTHGTIPLGTKQMVRIMAGGAPVKYATLTVEP